MTVPVGKLRLRLAATPMALAAATFVVGAAGFIATLEMPDYSRKAPALAEAVWARSPVVAALAEPLVELPPVTAEEPIAAESPQQIPVVAARASVARPTVVAVAPIPAAAPEAALEPSPSLSPSATPSATPSASASPSPAEVSAAGTPVLAIAEADPGASKTQETPADQPASPSPAALPAPAAGEGAAPGRRLGAGHENPGKGASNPGNDKSGAKAGEEHPSSNAPGQNKSN